MLLDYSHSLRPCHSALACAVLLTLLLGCGKQKDPAPVPVPTVTTTLPVVVKTHHLVVYSVHTAAQSINLTSFGNAYPEIGVEVINLSGAAALERLRAEKDAPKADLWCGASQDVLEAAAAEGLLQVFMPTWAEKVPKDFRSAEHYWYGQYLEPFVILFNSTKFNRDQVPTTFDALFEPEWHRKLALTHPRKSDVTALYFGAMVSSIENTGGTKIDGYLWLTKMHDATGAYTGSSELMYKAVARGRTPIAITEMSTARHAINHGSLNLDVILPEATIVRVSGLAVIANARDTEAATIFYEFISRTAEIVEHANKHQTIPARTDIPPEYLLPWMCEQPTPLEVDWANCATQIETTMEYWENAMRR